MFDASPFKPAAWEDFEAALADAVQSSAGGQMTRNADCVFMRHTD
jgi:hypothetical protein